MPEGQMKTPRPKIKWTDPPVIPDPVPDWANPERPDLKGPEPPSPEAITEFGEMGMEEMRRQKDLEHLANVARGAAREAVSGVLAEHHQAELAARDQEQQKVAPFQAFLESLRDLSEESQVEARTELRLQLFRLEDSGGPKARRIYCQELTLDPAEVKALGDPAFERRAQEYAERAGRFGRYEWRMKGWALGELTLDTSTTVHVEPPPGYVPPANPTREDQPKEDPMGKLNETMDLMSRFANLFGGNKGGGMDHLELKKLEAMAREEGCRAGETKGRLDAEREHRKELDDLRERHRRELEDAERRGLERGKVEGARDVREELAPRLWQLEAGTSPEPSLVSELVSHLGGPQAFQGLVGSVLTNLNKPKAAARIPRRPPVLGPMHQAPAAPTPQPPAAMNPSQEPNRAEYLEVMDLLADAIATIEEAVPSEAPMQAAQLEQLKGLLEAFQVEGTKDGSLAAWWADWKHRWKPNVEAILKAAEDHQTAAEHPPSMEEGVNLDALKGMLIEALDQGKDNATILADLKTTIPKDIRDGWRAQIKLVPSSMVAGMIGLGQYHQRITGLLDAFKADQD